MAKIIKKWSCRSRKQTKSSQKIANYRFNVNDNDIVNDIRK